MGFSRQEYWSGLPHSSPGDLPSPGIEPKSPTLHRAFNGKNGSIYFSASWKNILRHLERAALSWKSLWRKWGCGENDCVTHVSLASLVRVNVVILMEMSPQICHAPQILHQLTLTRLAKSDSCQVCMRKILILWFNAHETRWGRR